MQVLEKNHHSAHAVINNSNEKTMGSEFSHALPVLDKVPLG
jgi:hypothetical protein